jgi:hypothetical protein
MTTGKPILSNLKDLVLCRELRYGTSNMLLTAVADGAAAADRVAVGAVYEGVLIDGAVKDGLYMVGCLITFVSGTAANKGLTRRIIGYTSGADNFFTLDSVLPANPANNDTAYIYKPFRAKLNTFKLNVEKLPRDYHTSSYERPSPVVGKNSGDLDFTTEFLCDSINDTSALSAFTKSVSTELMEACFGKPFQAASAVHIHTGVIDGTTQFHVDDVTGLVVKGMLAIKNAAGTGWYIRQISAIDVALLQIQISVAVPVPLGVGTEVYRLATYRPEDLGTISVPPGATNSYENTRSVTIGVFKNNQLTTFAGCVGNVKTELTPAGLAQLTFTLKADTAVQVDGFTAEQQLWKDGIQFSTMKPPANLGGSVYNGATAWIATKLAFDFGLKTIEKPIFTSATGRNRFSNVGRDPKVSATIYNLSNGEMALFTANTTVGVFAQMGDPVNVAGGFAFAVEEAILADIQPSDMEGCEMYDATIQPCDDNTQATANTSRMAVAWFNDNLVS